MTKTSRVMAVELSSGVLARVPSNFLGLGLSRRMRVVILERRIMETGPTRRASITLTARFEV